MFFDLKTIVQPDAELSPQQKKLNRLIEQIEQQKIKLAAWQKAQAEIQQQARKTLVPICTELHNILFQQLEQLWNSVQRYEFSKADIAQLDDKIQNLAAILKSSQVLSEQQKLKVVQIDHFYQQHTEHNQAKKNKKKPTIESHDSTETYDQHLEYEQAEIDLDGYEYDEQQYEVEREQHRLNRQKQKREQAQKMAEQSLKTVYLKIASIIHPDREQDEQLKVEKTEMLQHANQAYEQQDLFYLLKLQIQVEQNRGITQKGLSNEQVKFYKLALEAQSQKLQSEIDDLIDTLVWSDSAKITLKKSKGKFQISDLYKQIDADTSALKQQVKVEKERLRYMGKLKGLEMLLGSGVL
ncbi:MAG: molecular chaperone DnaJ [Acinetobacter sp.]|uniref:molecular chaperone DnaJ n=1 Tax=Acinetobacter sp. TaxID=472 RepID=UPI00398296F3